MTHLTTLNELNQHITQLASVEVTDAPFISVYLNLGGEPGSWRDTLNNRARILRRVLKGDDLADFEEALEKIDAWLSNDLLPEAKSAAIFIRGIFGGSFMLPMQFAAPLPNRITVYPTPNIYNLVELKDNYHRYVVLLAMPDRTSILEVDLGSATTHGINRSDISKHVSSDCTHTHYQFHHAYSGNLLLCESIAILEKLIRSDDHTHLILAGDPEVTRWIQQALPDNLANKLVDIIPMNEFDQQEDVVMTTLSSFIAHEEQESRSIARQLIKDLSEQNLAVAGSSATLDALRRYNVNTLVMVSSYQPDPGWTCTNCKAIGVETPKTPICPQCGKLSVQPIDVREELLRLASQLQRPVEVVEKCDELTALDGIGCLLMH